MKHLKYFIQFLIIILLFLIFKIIGINLASFFGSFLGRFIGPLFRSKQTVRKNLKTYSKNISELEILEISKEMWSNIGSTFSEYVFLNQFKSKKKRIKIFGLEKLDEIKNKNKPVVFISGHFANFELMAMTLNNQGIKLATIYRPLNNYFLNPVMEYLRKKYICPNQIKKGRVGLKEILNKFNNSYSIALMIDQRVSEGIKVNLFNKLAYTTTMPAQLALRYKCNIVPVDIKRLDGPNFEIIINNPVKLDSYENNKENINSITLKLNTVLENMISSNKGQWIWTHDRWK